MKTGANPPVADRAAPMFFGVSEENSRHTPIFFSEIEQLLCFFGVSSNWGVGALQRRPRWRLEIVKFSRNIPRAALLQPSS